MKKSNPIVCLYAFAKWSSVKRIAIEVFPTAPSPSRITLYCSCSGSSSESSADRLAVEAIDGEGGELARLDIHMSVTVSGQRPLMLVDNVRWLCRETCELCWQLRTGEESWDPDALRRSTVVC